uniref:EF-hand domain-containing protein n=1 Tax=Pyramimonas obovata TaxID=1411642 RepID=A0A7S0QUV2_9CHLO|mmetsp:Transcript_21721/g.47705  ORF Transcript_21721/g.47705 Transcript_21721/m.47705 type:complete len:158 (+) Transcript_21721:303-776(+)|eukprot:CAMPEP_0118934520 /NCGR_PEP_ID=MMETSP1169-20130426/13872_1 /TAXON_ID=36882 /ORGANISM="Pyramimonas obovata, Strain CCMP722" /LENGTH=157 /DNA_ID=CAMNT_0006877435 /DNA_START=303 /DNA_END=776 /DNA_ORIENTATION=-
MALDITKSLNREELELCRNAFIQFDLDHSGTIDCTELRATLQSMGHECTEEEVYLMMAKVDDNGSGTLDFSEFLTLYAQAKKNEMDRGQETDTIQAFMALGGNADKTGEVAISKLEQVLDIFELNVRAKDIVEQYDTDKSGFIDFQEFKDWIGKSKA